MTRQPQEGELDEGRLDHSLDRPSKSESRLRWWVTTGSTVAILLTGLLGYASWRMSLRASDQADQVAHSIQIVSTLELTLRHLDDVETGVRGFCLTGMDQFLDPYESGRVATETDLAQLHRLSEGHAQQQQQLDELGRLAHRRLEAAKVIVAERRMVGKIPGSAELLPGKQLMDGMRALVEQLETDEKSRLGRRVQRSWVARHFTSSSIWLGTALTVLFLAVAGFATRREIRVTAKAQALVRTLNIDLERRVEQRTAALKTEVEARRKSDEQLRRSEEMFRLLLDGIQDYAIFRLDGNGCVASWNAGAARITGYQEAEALGRHVSVFYPPADHALQHLERSFEEAVRTGRFEEEGWRLRKDGSTFCANDMLTPLFELNGRLTGYSKVVRDVTDRRRADEEVKKQAALLNLALDAIVVRDATDRIAFWNNGAQKTYGWSSQEACGQTIHELLRTVFPVPLEEINRQLEHHGAWDGELRHRTRSGEEVIVTSRMSRQLEQLGPTFTTLEINRDITQRKADELEIRKLNEDLEERIALRTAQLEMVNQELEAFTYSVSHDLRAPLRHVRGFSTILLDDFGSVLPAEASAHLQRIGDATIRMGMLVDSLLALAKLGRQALRLQPHRLSTIVDQVIAMLQPEIEGRAVEWHVGDLPTIECDRILVGQVFQNLISNALKYSRGKSPAIIEVGSLPEEILFVRDNGAGFDMQYAQKLFEVFQRLHTESEFEGTGVGLATVQRIVKKHGGRVWAEAGVDRGATFYFTLSPEEAVHHATRQLTADVAG